ncbi:hypothetical protein GCM10027073_44070 [Streptomyces chlorus]
MTPQHSAADRSGPAGQDEAPKILDIPIGLNVTGTRRETESMGAIDVPADRYWGAQTQRSLIHFSIGDDRMPKAVYHSYGYVKKAAALVNGRAGRLPVWKADMVQRVADEVIAGKLDDHFPLYVWQTGAGTQSNMNTNEVISNRAVHLVGGELGSKSPIHPNDHVNMGQSSNDTFPPAMHIAAVKEIHEHLLPSVRALQQAIETKARQWRDMVKIGRTHLEDVVPLTVGQEWSGYAPSSNRRSTGSPGPPRACTSSPWAAPRSGPGSTPRPDSASRSPQRSPRRPTTRPPPRRTSSQPRAAWTPWSAPPPGCGRRPCR